MPEVVREESAHSDDFSRRRSAALYLALLSVLVLVIAGLFFGQYRPTMAETAFLGFGVALLGLLGIVRGGFSVDEVLIAMVALVITALILGTCVVMWPEDVSTKTQLTVGDVKQNGDGVMQNGDTATVIVGDPPAPHRQLRLTLASDDRGIGTPCAPRSELEFSGSDLERRQRVKVEDEMEVPLQLATQGPRITFTVTMHSGPGCRMAVQLKLAVYR